MYHHGVSEEFMVTLHILNMMKTLEAHAPPERAILFLCDDWSDFDDTISGINRSLCRDLAAHKGVKVYSTLLRRMNEIKPTAREDAEKSNITLIHPSTPSHIEFDSKNFGEDYKVFNETPLKLFQNLQRLIPTVSYIIGHAPITNRAALKLREVYPESKVILFYHVIPSDIMWLTGHLQFPIPDDMDLIQDGEEADLVYSVTSKVHWYYSAKFRNRAASEVNHKRFIPQCSEKTFSVRPKLKYRSANEETQSGQFNILAIAHGEDTDKWDGIDIAACCASKVALAARRNSTTRLIPRLTVLNLTRVAGVKVVRQVEEYTNNSDIVVQYKSPRNNEEILLAMEDADLILVPCRAEPHGAVGFTALSSGVPTLISESSSAASVIERLMSEPECYTVPVTPSTQAVRQDASVWRDRVLAIMQDPELAADRAYRLKMALRRDEPTKETFDSMATYCLGGIRLRFEVIRVATEVERNESLELETKRSLSKLISELMKQCWRLKHHPLTNLDDLFPLVPRAELPVEMLMKKVTNKIEEMNRRIVGFEDDSGSFVVYCPTTDALRDLWSMCDVINNLLVAILLGGGKNNPVLGHFSIRAAVLRASILGAEFLQYKDDLLVHTRPKTAAF